MGKGIGGHERPNRGATNDWITPPYIVASLGRFDLDPCESVTQPWKLAGRGYTKVEDGLSKIWYGRVWCNPPYDNVSEWVERMARHGNGIALIFARFDVAYWHETIFPTASGYLFPKGRISFYRPDGTKGKSTSGAPSVLVAWGPENFKALQVASERDLIVGRMFGPSMA